jgi:hypothetical protein
MAPLRHRRAKLVFRRITRNGSHPWDIPVSVSDWNVARNPTGGAPADPRRRDFVKGIAWSTIAWPLTLHAEVSPKRPLIAWLSGGTKASSLGFANLFLEGMRELGYTEGHNFDMVYRFSEGFQDRLPSLAEELVRLKPNVILAPAPPRDRSALGGVAFPLGPAR